MNSDRDPPTSVKTPESAAKTTPESTHETTPEPAPVSARESVPDSTAEATPEAASKTSSFSWAVLTIDQLSARELHALMKLRVDVFVVEQACAYPEVDELDASPDTLHLIVSDGPKVIATARAMAPEKHAEVPHKAVRIGRVAVHPSYRGRGLAKQMMVYLMRENENRWGVIDFVLGAQSSVKGFYASLGYETTSEPYLEDGIEHVDMRYRAQAVCSSNRELQQ